MHWDEKMIMHIKRCINWDAKKIMQCIEYFACQNSDWKWAWTKQVLCHLKMNKNESDVVDKK